MTKLQAACRLNFSAYVAAVDRDYVCEDYLSHLHETLMRVEKGEITRCYIHMPPRHGKSITVSQLYPAWISARHPDANIVLISHNKNLTERNAVAVRKLIQSRTHRAIFPEHQITPGDSRRDAFSIQTGMRKNGSIRAISACSGITGHGADYMIIDDPIASVADAYSPTMREKLFHWYVTEAYTRLNENSSRMIIMHTRWHSDDLAGRLTSEEHARDLEGAGLEKYSVFRYAAESDGPDSDPLKRPVGRYLSTSRISESTYKAARITQRLMYNAMYQGVPVESAYKLSDPADYEIVSDYKVDQLYTLGIDLAYSAGQGDETAIAHCTYRGAGEDATLYIHKITTLQEKYPDVRKKIAGILQTGGVRLLTIEGNGPQKGLYDDIKTLCGLHDVQIIKADCSRDKASRYAPVAAAAAAGRVKLVRSGLQSDTWISAFLKQLSNYPAGRDDMLDAVAHAYAAIRTHGVKKFGKVRHK